MGPPLSIHCCNACLPISIVAFISEQAKHFADTTFVIQWYVECLTIMKFFNIKQINIKNIGSCITAKTMFFERLHGDSIMILDGSYEYYYFS